MPQNGQRYEAWMILHDSHGVCLDNLIFLPAGERPETSRNWVRAAWLDSVPATDKETTT